LSRLLRRLQKLEARLTDRSGLVPRTKAWFDYWLPKVDRIPSGGDAGEPGRTPLAVSDAINDDSFAFGSLNSTYQPGFIKTFFPLAPTGKIIERFVLTLAGRHGFDC